MLPFWLVVAGLLWGVTQWMDWHSAQVTLPRYCREPREALLERVGRVVREARPAREEEATRPYVLAARLVFLIPRRAGESDSAWLDRLKSRLEAQCR